MKPEKPECPGFVYKFSQKTKPLHLDSLFFINIAWFPESSTVGHLERNHSLLMEKQINNILTQLMHFVGHVIQQSF